MPTPATLDPIAKGRVRRDFNNALAKHFVPNLAYKIAEILVKQPSKITDSDRVLLKTNRQGIESAVGSIDGYL